MAPDDACTFQQIKMIRGGLHCEKQKLRLLWIDTTENEPWKDPDKYTVSQRHLSVIAPVDRSARERGGR